MFTVFNNINIYNSPRLGYFSNKLFVFLGSIERNGYCSLGPIV